MNKGKNYIYSFWNKRRTEDITLIELIKGYQALVEYIGDKFGSPSLEGWKTDRGKIWLKYGAPHHIEQYPRTQTERAYEIWRYNRLANQKNVSFIFYEADAGRDKFVLIHSDKYGEMRNPRWRTLIEVD